MKKAGFPGTVDILGSISSKDGVVMYGLLMSIESIPLAQFKRPLPVVVSVALLACVQID